MIDYNNKRFSCAQQREKENFAKVMGVWRVPPHHPSTESNWIKRLKNSKNKLSKMNNGLRTETDPTKKLLTTDFGKKWSVTFTAGYTDSDNALVFICHF